MFCGNSMCIADKINEFEIYSKQLTKAIEIGNEEELRNTDALIHEILQEMLAAEPENKEAKKLLAQHLLNYLVPNADRSEYDQRVCTRLLDLLNK